MKGNRGEFEAPTQQGEQENGKAHRKGKGQQQPKVPEQEHPVQLVVIRKPQSPHGESQENPRQQRSPPNTLHDNSLSIRNETTMATPKNTAVAMRLAGCNRPQPLSP